MPSLKHNTVYKNSLNAPVATRNLAKNTRLIFFMNFFLINYFFNK